MRSLFKEVTLSQEFLDHFAGLMLGDGYLSNRNKSPHSCQFLLTSKNLSYLYFVGNLLDREGIEYRIDINNKLGNFPGSKVASMLSTKFYVTFAELEAKWYNTNPDGTHYKIVPRDLVLNPTTLLQWYLGDGYLVHLRGTPVRVQFCTERYTDEEIAFLRDRFVEDFGINAQIDWNRRRIRIPERELDKFFRILPPCPSELESEFSYKWI